MTMVSSASQHVEDHGERVLTVGVVAVSDGTEEVCPRGGLAFRI